MIKVFSAFSGYGGFEWGLIKANIQYECVGISEIDKYAIQCYNQNFPNIKNYGDITKINEKELPDFDLFVGGFPCQSFSIAGQRKGFEDTRGTLIFDVLRICKEKQPKWIVLENVKGLVNHNKGNTLKVILDSLKEIGYQVIWKILNTKKLGIPQNRERIFIVCFRNDIYKPLEFQFPSEEPLKLLLKDILEDEVEAKYYLKPEQVRKLLSPELWNISSFRKRNIVKNNIVQTLQSAMSHGNTIPCIDVKDLIGLKNRNFSSSAKVLDTESISPTLQACMGNGGNQVNYVVSCALRSYPRTNNPERDKEIGRFQNLEIGKEFSNTISSVQKDSLITNSSFIRKLTPKECFRLQGFLNDEINLDGLSDTQKYRLAGNGISINVTEKLFKRLFKEE